jgi:hypothetical protein
MMESGKRSGWMAVLGASAACTGSAHLMQGGSFGGTPSDLDAGARDAAAQVSITGDGAARTSDLVTGDAQVAFDGGYTSNFADAAVSAASCASTSETLRSALYGSGPQAFTVVVRLSHQTREILGFQVIAGKYHAPTEQEAKATAQADTGFGDTSRALHTPNPSDEYVWYETPGDLGGVGVVSARTGLAVFGGGIVWDGAGEISYPKTWRPVAELGPGCRANVDPRPSHGFDLISGHTLAQTDVEAALDVVKRTALPDSIASGGSWFDSVVLRYPRTVGGFNATTAEWIVLVNGGWLE